jgi:PIN domain nuclease of toxin-antitoxin system
VRILLDTHVFLWLQVQPERLGDHLAAVADTANERLLSAASSWEIAIKHGLGRLSLPEPPASWVPERMRAVGAMPLAVEHTHALAVADLPVHHRDPFDRLLVAQAQEGGYTLVTADRRIPAYDVAVLDPRT